MRFLRSFLFLAIFVLFTTALIFADVLKVRVTASMANIRLKPSIQSEIISKIPLGSVLDIIKKEGNWYFVKLPPDEKGILVTGYIHQSIVEVIGEMEIVEKVEEKKVEEQKVDIIEKKEKSLKIPSKPVEPPKIATKDVDYQEWKIKYDKAEADFLKWEKYRKIGMYTTFSVGLGLPLLVILTKELSLLPGTGLTLVGIGGAGLWGYANGKKAAAADRKRLLTDEGKIKGYISASINPEKKCYAITFTLSF